QPFQVDAAGLKRITVESLAMRLQVTKSNPMAGLEGRAGLLIRLSEALSNQEIFGHDGRPGNMIGKSTCGLGNVPRRDSCSCEVISRAYRSEVFFQRLLTMADYLLSHPTTTVSPAPVVSLATLWSVLMD